MSLTGEERQQGSAGPPSWQSSSARQRFLVLSSPGRLPFGGEIVAQVDGDRLLNQVEIEVFLSKQGFNGRIPNFVLTCGDECASEEGSQCLLFQPIEGNSIPVLLTLQRIRLEVHATWQPYIAIVNSAIQMNFWGNRSTLRDAAVVADGYLESLHHLGLSLTAGRALEFGSALKRLLLDLEFTDVPPHQKIWPGRALFPPSSGLDGDFPPAPVFLPLTGPCPGALMGSEMADIRDGRFGGILSPLDFFRMIDGGLFPMGDHRVLHTNQALAEHDLAHLVSFVRQPAYMAAMRRLASRVLQQADPVQNPASHADVKAALLDFESPFATRLYYAAEIFVTILPEKRPVVEGLINCFQYQLPFEWASVSRPNVEAFLFGVLHEVGPMQFMCFLSDIYDQFLSFATSLGGESLDVINRARKFDRPNKALRSEFEMSSIHYWHQKGLRCLRNIRPVPEQEAAFCHSIKAVHTVFIGALIGTSLLSIDDWLVPSAEFVVPPLCLLRQYICGSGLWAGDSLLYECFAH